MNNNLPYGLELGTEGPSTDPLWCSSCWQPRMVWVGMGWALIHRGEFELSECRCSCGHRFGVDEYGEVTL